MYKWKLVYCIIKFSIFFFFFFLTSLAGKFSVSIADSFSEKQVFKEEREISVKHALVNQ